MNETQTDTEACSLFIERTFPVTSDKVFKAWTKSEALCNWFAPSDEMKTEILELDVRVGGRYCLKMINTENEEFIVAGEYVAIEPNQQLIFTWQWQSHEGSVEMLITLNFIENNGVTDFSLLQERIPNKESRDEHNKGWTGCLARLGTCLEN